MFRLRFGQVFFAVMALSLVSSFVAPPRFGSGGRLRFDSLLIPVSEPSFHLVNWARRLLTRQTPRDNRADETIIAENLALKEQVRNLNLDIERLERVAGERTTLGDLKSFCDRFRVAGTDGDNRDGLFIAGLGMSRVAKDQAVITEENQLVELVGKITDASAVSAHVRLLSDAGFVVTGRFMTFTASHEWKEKPDVVAIVSGSGKNGMSITNVHLEDVPDVNPGDWVVLSDDNWPTAVQRQRIGRIVSKDPLARQSQFADIRLVTDANMMHAPDVWVMTHPQ
jgi:hypothetical protein